jgi:hypothetical protein
VLFVAVNEYVFVEVVARAVVESTQPVDAAFLVISEINNPVTFSLKVAVKVYVLVADGGIETIEFPPFASVVESVTVGRVASITTFAKAVEAVVVVPPND